MSSFGPETVGQQSEAWRLTDQGTIIFDPERLIGCPIDGDGRIVVAGLLTELTKVLDANADDAHLFGDFRSHSEREWNAIANITTAVNVVSGALDKVAPRDDGSDWSTWYMDEYQKISSTRDISA